MSSEDEKKVTKTTPKQKTKPKEVDGNKAAAKPKDTAGNKATQKDVDGNKAIEKPKPKRRPRKRPPRRSRSNSAEATKASEPKAAKSSASTAVPAKEKTAKQADTVETKKPTRKRAPRRKPKVEATETSAPSGNPTKQPEATAEVTDETKASEKKKPARKRAPRRKPKAAPKSEASAESAEPASKDTEQTAKKQPAKKPAAQKGNNRRKKPATKPTKAAASTTTAKDDNIAFKLLINADEPEECRIALLENGKVESFNTETVVRAQTKGNIYKGIITAIEPNLQAAFVDMGTGKNGFLPFSDIHPEYYCKEVPKGTHWKRLKIQEVIRRGQEVLVEVVKEPTGNKGANITTFLSMPGRFLVLMPGSDSHGISRKISDEARRSKLREIVISAKLPEEIGYIIRTASTDVTKTALMKDIRYQLNLWKEIKNKGQTEKAPAIVYKEQDVVSRFLRDNFTPEIQEIMVDNQEVYTKVQEFLELLPARQRTAKVKLHRGSRPIFNQYQVEEQIEVMYQPQVPLPSGGSIVINPTEALVAIDVNSGRTSKDKDFEKSITLANMEAAEELARQLRLRDLGGLIVVDFIDMRDKRNIREVEKKMKTSMKRDKAKVDMSRISKFGLLQISRQRLGPPIQKGNYVACEHCQGHGVVRSVETTALAIMRRIQTGAAKKGNKIISCNLPLNVAQYLLNQKRSDLLDLEKRYRVEIRITPNPELNPSQGEVQFQKG